MRTGLLIEDDPKILEFEPVVLSMSGDDVLIATNGREGIETLRTSVHRRSRSTS
jgi:DNA-binding response OmpR family regulator